MNGLGIKISNNLFRYGIWKDGEKEFWLQGPWEMRKYAKPEQLKYLKILEKNQSKIMNFIKKNITPDLEDYSYDRLINQLKNKFSSAYPKSKIDNAIQYIPDIQFLIISSQKM